MPYVRSGLLNRMGTCLCGGTESGEACGEMRADCSPKTARGDEARSVISCKSRPQSRESWKTKTAANSTSEKSALCEGELCQCVRRWRWRAREHTLT